MSSNKRVLGFDCSSSCIGYSILEITSESEIKYISMDYLNPIKTGTIVQRLADTRDKIQKIIEETQPDYIGIEDIIKFMKGASSANTVILLTSFNRMICLLAHDYLKKFEREPALFSVMSIRHGLKLNKIFPKKEDMPELVSHHLRITFPWEMNKKNKPRVECYDKADGTAVCLYYSFILTDKVKPPKKKK